MNEGLGVWVGSVGCLLACGGVWHRPRYGTRNAERGTRTVALASLVRLVGRAGDAGPGEGVGDAVLAGRAGVVYGRLGKSG